MNARPPNSARNGSRQVTTGIDADDRHRDQQAECGAVSRTSVQDDRASATFATTPLTAKSVAAVSTIA